MRHAQTTWPEVAIEDFAEVVTGGTPSTAKSEYWKGGKIPWLNSGELNKRIITHADNFITEDGLKNSAAQMMPEDTVLVALTGATTGVSALLKMSACANQSVTGILPSKRHHPHFLFHYMQSIRHGIISDSYGGAQKHISQAYVKQLKVPLPSVDEQARIAILLDEADKLRKLGVQADGRTAELIPAIFNKMFGDPASGSNRWPIVSLKDMGKVTTGNTPSRNDPEHFGTFVEWIKTNNIDATHGIITTAAERLSEKGTKVGRVVPSGTILIICIAGSRGYLGDAAVVDRQVAINQQINAITPNHDVDSYFLCEMIVAMKTVIQHRATGVMTGIINKSTLESIPMICPPFPLQKEFAQRVKEIRELEAGQATSRARLDALFQSMLHGAFNGEL
jgi:type I restriction enzyme S subunit